MNKPERVACALSGNTPDKIPLTFWYSYFPVTDVGDVVEKQIALYRETDMDILKVTYDLKYPVDLGVRVASDWYRVKPEGKGSKLCQTQVDILRRIVDRLHGECAIWGTLFGPMRAAAWSVGDDHDLFMAHYNENPDAVISGVSAIADSFCEWAAAYLDTGIDSVFYPAQYGEVGRFSHEDFARLVMPNDIKVIQAAKATGKPLILHPCGQANFAHKVNLQWYTDYPYDAANWATQANGLSLAEGRALFGSPVMGGFPNKAGLLADGSADAVRAQTKALIAQAGAGGLLLGADCTLGSAIKPELLKAVSEAAYL